MECHEMSKAIFWDFFSQCHLLKYLPSIPSVNNCASSNKHKNAFGPDVNTDDPAQPAKPVLLGSLFYSNFIL